MQVLTRKEEVFKGSETGDVNVTKLREWLEINKRKPQYLGMMKDNVLELLSSHEWDDDFDDRIAALLKIKKKWKPLICVQSEEGSCWVIDGWHRMTILHAEQQDNEHPHIEFLGYMVTKEECKMFPIVPNLLLMAGSPLIM